jgi:type I restriction enzyme S subunit
MSKTATLGEVASFINGFAFKPSDWSTAGLPIIRIQNLTGSSDEINYYDGEYPDRVEINDGDVLISWSASLGVYVWQGGKALLNQHIFKVAFDKGEIDKMYFVYAVQEKIAEMVSKTHGSTMKHIVKGDFGKTRIPLPSLDDQRCIAAVLDKTRALIALRKQQLEQLDLMVNSRFVEMFGEPESNPMGWVEVCFGELFTIIDGDRGVNYPKGADFFDSGYCLFLNTGNITSTGFNFQVNQFITLEKDAQLRKGRLEREDIILTTRGTVGNIAFYDYTIPYDVMRINSGMVLLREYADKIEAEYIISLVRCFGILERYLSGSAQPQMPISTMKNIRVPLPPLDLQTRFAEFARAAGKSKFAMRQGLKQLELQYNALMQQYFG